MVVVDRAIHESKGEFPMLSQIKSEAGGINFGGLLEKTDTIKADELRLALRDLLIELLRVFGNITADILTVPLHQELMSVTNDSPLKASLPQALRAMNPAKNNREKK